MSFPQYAKYEESGIEWLGRVPGHWSIRRLGFYFSERREKVSDKEFRPLSVTKNGIVPQLETAAKTDDGDNRKLVLAGDFVINSRSDRKGSAGLAEIDGSVSLINTVLAPLDRVAPLFVGYLLKSIPFQEEFYRYGQGIVADLWTTKYSEMKAIQLAMPPLAEQCAIAAFLDRETAKIDALIEEQTRLMAILKEKRQAVVSEAVTKGVNLTVPMKSSDVESLGNVPQHWELVRLKFLMKLTPGFAFKSEDFVHEGIQLIRIGNLYLNRLSLDREPVFLPWSFVAKHTDMIVTAGDLLMSLTGTLGKKDYGYAVLLRSPDKFLLNQRVCGLRFRQALNHEYAEYLLQSSAFTEQIHRLPFGTKQANLSSEDVLSAWIPLAPRREQDQIAAFLNVETAKLGALHTEAERAIDLLKERRTVLISSAVIGKIDVRGLAETDKPLSEVIAA